MRPTSVTIGPCRISYPNLFKAKASAKFPMQGARFSCDILIPKSDQTLVSKVMAAVGAAKEAGIKDTWGGKEPKKLNMPLKDGDERDDENYHGMYILSPWSKEDRPPKVMDASLQPIIDQSEIYGGMWANVNVNFYPYDNSGAGIGCGFDAGVQKVRDDEPFGGGATSAEEAFGAAAPAAAAAIDPLTGKPVAQAAVEINPLTGKPY